jgi:transcription initiation factor IIF auxiliary subunit
MIKVNNYAEKIDTRNVKGREYNWYRWMIFIDEPDEVLNTIDSVDYLLHPTFPNPQVNVSDRSTKFAYETVGWGMFTVYVTVYFKSGEAEETRYTLNFTGKPYPI